MFTSPVCRRARTDSRSSTAPSPTMRRRRCISTGSASGSAAGSTRSTSGRCSRRRSGRCPRRRSVRLSTPRRPRAGRSSTCTDVALRAAMRVCTVLLIVSTSLPAFAEPDTREAAMLYDVVPVRRDQLGWRFRIDALAAAIATTDGKERQGGGLVRLEVGGGWAEHAQSADVRPKMDVVLRNFRYDYGDGGPPLTLATITVGLDVLTVTGDPAAPDVAGLAGDLARIDGVRAGGLRFGARLGGRVMDESKGTMATYQDRLWVIGEGGVSAERDLARGVTMRLAGDRNGWPVWDGRFVVDDRATWSVLAQRRRLSARIDLAAAATHVLQIDGDRTVATGGVTADGQLVLGAGFGLKLRSEVGRSVYAAGATLDEPRWASETWLMLVAHTSAALPHT